MERNPHNGGHRAVGGEMTNPISSPGDPLFYLHHTFLDRVWWRWQALDKENRVKDIAGYTSNPEPPTGYVDAKLDTVLNMYGVTPNATVADVMDIGGDLLCHEYVDPQGKGGKKKSWGKKEEKEDEKDEKDEETDDEDGE
jgi:tyrosinase